MKLATRIFHRTDWYITSPFGYRYSPITGKYSFHSGCDYGTNIQPWPQYALENGTVAEIVKNHYSFGNYVRVNYPRLNISLLHAHLKSISVKKGQTVDENTVLGLTGATGQATGVHLHLGMTKIGNSTWLNPEDYDYIAPEEPTPTPTPTPTKTIEELAKEVINGKWGNGEDRYKRLTGAGYNYDEVQKRVNEILGGSSGITTYRVKLGDNLTKIARMYNTTVQRLIDLNKAKYPAIASSRGNYIQTGWTLRVK